MATIARIPYTKQLLSDPDYLYNFTDLAIWSTVEIGLGLTASSLATLKPLFRKLKILVATKSGSHASNTLPYHYSRSTHPQARSSPTSQSGSRETKKLRKSPPIGSPAMRGFKPLDGKPSATAGAFELSLMTESSSVKTVITAGLSAYEGSKLSPPLPAHHHSFRQMPASSGTDFDRPKKEYINMI